MKRKTIITLLLLSTLLLSTACSTSSAEEQDIAGEVVEEETTSEPTTEEEEVAVIEIDADFVVTSTENEGSGSLREAVEQAESGDVIAFAPTVFDPTAPATIYLTSPIFLGKGGVTIDASNAGVILDGSMGSETGILIQSSDNVVYGIKLTSFLTGIEVDGEGDQTKTQHNQIGGDPSIGNGPYGQGNCLVFNENGISIQRGSSENTVSGNLIGLEADGSPNGNLLTGVIVQAEANRNTIGPNNTIANNGQTGITVHGGSVDNTITQTIVFDNENGNVAFSNGGNFESEIVVEEIESIDREQGYISGQVYINGENVTLEIYSGDTNGPRYYEGEPGNLQSADGGIYIFNFLKGSLFNGEYIYITGYDGTGNSTLFSEPISTGEVGSNASDAFMAISTVLNQPRVAWGQDFNDLEEPAHWTISQEWVVENGALVLSLPDTDWHMAKLHGAVTFYADQVDSETLSQAVHLTFSFSGDKQFRMEASYNSSDSFETYNDGGMFTAEFPVMFRPNDTVPENVPYLGVQADNYASDFIPMQGATSIEPDTQYEMLIAIDNIRQELLAVIWEPGNFDYATFARMQNDEKLIEMTSAGKPWGFSIHQWGGENTLYIGRVEYLAFEGLSLP